MQNAQTEFIYVLGMIASIGFIIASFYTDSILINQFLISLSIVISAAILKNNSKTETK
jgi:hypothetical protein